MELDGKVFDILRREDPGNFIVYAEYIDVACKELKVTLEDYNFKVNIIDSKSKYEDVLEELSRIRKSQHKSIDYVVKLGYTSIKNHNRVCAVEIKPEVLIIEDSTGVYNELGERKSICKGSRIKDEICAQLDAVRKLGWCSALTVILICKDKCEYEDYFYLLKDGKGYNINTGKQI